MDSGYESNAERLQRAGFRIETTMPQPYMDVIAGLTDEEVDTLIEVKRRLDEVEASTVGAEQPWDVFFVPF